MFPGYLMRASKVGGQDESIPGGFTLELWGQGLEIWGYCQEENCQVDWGKLYWEKSPNSQGQSSHLELAKGGPE